MVLKLLALSLAVPLFHWVGDWVFQSRHIAVNKSENNHVLLNHVMLYTYFGLFPIGLLACGLGLMNSIGFVIFILGNLLAHFITDYITSRKNKEFYQAGEMQKFWTSIGFDQVLHYVVLILTLFYCYGSR